jgi:hypothetical protein
MQAVVLSICLNLVVTSDHNPYFKLIRRNRRRRKQQIFPITAVAQQLGQFFQPFLICDIEPLQVRAIHIDDPDHLEKGMMSESNVSSLVDTFSPRCWGGGH